MIKVLNLVMVLACFQAADAVAQGMQHGFILAEDDSLASHLVASGHHSRQVNVTGQLSIPDADGRRRYVVRRASANGTYFLFQAQNLDLPDIAVGQVLRGHIVESEIGTYDPNSDSTI